jgi:hypothetical protein
MLAIERFYSDAPYAGLLFLEGALAALLGTMGALFLFPDQSGLVSIFLCAIASLKSIERQLEWNRRMIVEENRPPTQINAIFTARVLALFVGQVAAYSGLVLFVEVTTIQMAFSYQLGDFVGMQFPAMSFPSVGVIFVHNIGVLSLFFALSLIFSHGGALLAVAWNASVWGVVFGWLARSWSTDGGPPLLEGYARVVLGVFPHMALEAAAYVLGGFAAVFLGKALASYDLANTRWESLLKTVAGMVFVAVLLVGFGALWEGLVAPSVVSFLSS